MNRLKRTEIVDGEIVWDEIIDINDTYGHWLYEYKHNSNFVVKEISPDEFMYYKKFGGRGCAMIITRLGRHNKISENGQLVTGPTNCPETANDLYKRCYGEHANNGWLTTGSI
ncbi:hypothetical protein SEA_JUMBO_87 [Gordonia phage Jumbo]|uniref:Uncharacterized protein n=1 Tax=Gordonia phage Jumbo TaxID=1887650 RepID=A0A1B3B0Q5_9CAUD|nr:hypothetical protein BIZ69_gp087 [Gordonia phage Jumbo]AOE44595.1 hypothetical protein SEA_JUMBO_87 [Gordonia phage Jumbo]